MYDASLTTEERICKHFGRQSYDGDCHVLKPTHMKKSNKWRGNVSLESIGKTLYVGSAFDFESQAIAESERVVNELKNTGRCTVYYHRQPVTNYPFVEYKHYSEDPDFMIKNAAYIIDGYYVECSEETKNWIISLRDRLRDVECDNAENYLVIKKLNEEIKDLKFNLGLRYLRCPDCGRTLKRKTNNVTGKEFIACSGFKLTPTGRKSKNSCNYTTDIDNIYRKLIDMGKI